MLSAKEEARRLREEKARIEEERRLALIQGDEGCKKVNPMHNLAKHGDKSMFVFGKLPLSQVLRIFRKIIKVVTIEFHQT